MQEDVNKSPINDVNELKQWLIETLMGMQQCIIDKAVNEWQNVSS